MTSLTRIPPETPAAGPVQLLPRAGRGAVIRARCRGRRAAGGRVRGGLRGRAAACRAPRAGPCSGLGAGPSRDGGSSPGPWTPKPPAPWLPGTGRLDAGAGRRVHDRSPPGSASVLACQAGASGLISAPAAAIVWARAHSRRRSVPDASGRLAVPGVAGQPSRISQGPGQRMRARSGCDTPARPPAAPAVRNRQADSNRGLSGRAAVYAGPARRLAGAPPPALLAAAGRRTLRPDVRPGDRPGRGQRRVAAVGRLRPVGDRGSRRRGPGQACAGLPGIGPAQALATPCSEHRADRYRRRPAREPPWPRR